MEIPSVNGPIVLYEDNQDPRSPKYRFGPRDARATRSWQLRDCDENARWALAEALLGFSVLEETEGVRYLRRELPLGFPVGATVRNPARESHLYVSELPTFEPISKSLSLEEDTDTPTATYECCRVACVFDTLPYLVRSDSEMVATSGPLVSQPDEGFWLANGGWLGSRYVSRRRDHGPRTISLPPSTVQYTSSIDPEAVASPIKEGIPYSQYREVREYTWHAVPVEAIPEASIRVGANKVNDAEFDGCPLGTLLFLSDRIDEYPAPLGGGFLADITYRMSYLPNIDPNTNIAMGWNALFRVFKGKFYSWPMSTDGSTAIDNTTRIVGYHDFASLFRPDQP